MSTVPTTWISSELEGSRVLLRLTDGDIEGVVAGVCEKSSRLSVTEVVDAETREPLLGTFHCRAKDIASCVVLEHSTHKKCILPDDEDGPKLLRLRTTLPHIEKRNASENSCEFICHRMEGDNSEPIKKGSIKLMGSLEDLPELKQPIATEFEIIDKVNDHLSEAIAAVKNEKSISVGYEGTKVGRHGFLSVLMVATSSKLYIFDVFALEKEVFSHGLKDILESENIEKVIHGCRHLSDCLYHQYQVSLENVFDTMVADVIIHHDISVDAGHNQFPNFLRGVQQCIRTFLKFNYLQLRYTRSRQGRHEQEVSTWKQRPLSLRQIDALARDMVFLGELAQACRVQMLKRFYAGVNFFLGLDRQCTDCELDCLPAAHVLPRSFADALKCATSRSEQQWLGYTDHDRNREDRRYGRKENRFYERDNTRRGSSWVNADRTQPREDASYRGGQVWRSSEFSEERTYKEDSLLYIGMRQRARENPVPRGTTGPTTDGTCNGSESQEELPGSKEAPKELNNVPVSKPLVKGPEHASGIKPLVQHCIEAALGAANEKCPQDLNGDVSNIAGIQHQPFHKSRLLSLCLEHPQTTSEPEENAAVIGQEHDKGIEAAVDVKKEVPKCHSAWGNRPIDTAAANPPFQPAGMIVENCPHFVFSTTMPCSIPNASQI